MEWLFPLVLLTVGGGMAWRDAWMDRSARSPEFDWWRRKPSPPFWTHKRTKAERWRGRTRLG